MKYFQAVFLILISGICLKAYSQQHLSLNLELEEDERYVPYLAVKLKNVSNKSITVSNSSLTEMRKRGRMVEGENTICCFKNTARSGQLFYGGSFILDRENDYILLNPGEDACFKTKLAGAGMPFDGAISFYNKQARDYNKISCYLENILYTVDEDGSRHAGFNIESNIISIVDLKMIDDEFMNITLNYNGANHNYLLFFIGKSIPDKAEDLQALYTRILKRRGFSAPLHFKTGENTASIWYDSGQINMSSSFFSKRLTNDDLADIYKYCLLAYKYRAGRKPYIIKSNGDIQMVNNSVFPKAYINDMVSSLREVMACEGVFYTLSEDKRNAYYNEISYWKKLLDDGTYY